MSTLYSYKQIVTGCAESLDVDPILFNSEIVQNPNPWDNSSSYATPQTSDKTDVSGAGTSGTSGASGYAAPTFAPLSIKGSSSITALLLAGAAASFSKSFSSSPSTAVTLPTSVQNVLDSTSKLINSGVNYVSNTVKNIVNPDGSNALNNSVATSFATPVSQTTLAGLVGIPSLGGTTECVGVVKGLTDLTGSSSQITSGLNLQNNLSVIPVGTAIGSGFGANGNYGTAAMPGGQMGYNHQTVITGFVDAKGNQLPLNADGTAQDPSQVAGFTSLNQWNGSNGTYQGTYYFKGNNSTDAGLTNDGSSYYTLRRPSESTGQLHTAGSNSINTQLSTNPSIQNNINTTSVLVSPTSFPAINTVAPYSSLAPKVDQNGATLSPNGYYVNPANPGWPPPPNTTLAAGTAGTSSAVYTAPLTSATEGQANLINPYGFAGSNQAYIPGYDQSQNAYNQATISLKTNTATYDQARADVVKNTEVVNYNQNQVLTLQGKYDELTRPVLNEQGQVIGTYGSTTAIYQAESNLNIAKANLEDANGRLQASTELATSASASITVATDTINSVSPTYSINNGVPTFATSPQYTDTGLNGVTMVPTNPNSPSTAFGINGIQNQSGGFILPTSSVAAPQDFGTNGIGYGTLPTTIPFDPAAIQKTINTDLAQTSAIAMDNRYITPTVFNENAIQQSINTQLAAEGSDRGYGSISISTPAQTQIDTSSVIQTTGLTQYSQMQVGQPYVVFNTTGQTGSLTIVALPTPDKASSIEANFPLPQNQSTIEANFPLPQNQSTIEANYPGNTPIDGTPVGFNSLTSGNGPTQIPLDAAQNPLNGTRDSLSAPIGVDGVTVGYDTTISPNPLASSVGGGNEFTPSVSTPTSSSSYDSLFNDNVPSPQTPSFAGGNFSTSGYTVPGDVGGNGGFTLTNSRTDFAPVTNAGGTAVAKPGQGGTAGSETPGSSQMSGQQMASC